MDIWAILVAWGVPTAVAGTIIGIMFKRFEKRMDEERKARRDFEAFQVKGLCATMKVCEANAIALQNGKCNGETHAALEYMQEVKRDQRDFLYTHGIEHIF
jgi:hypothetical protein